jgi:hypothetical protein
MEASSEGIEDQAAGTETREVREAEGQGELPLHSGLTAPGGVA